MYVKTPLREQKIKPNRRGISGGAPSARKRRSGVGNGFKSPGPGSHGRRVRQESPKKKATLPAFTPWKVILASFLIGVCGILYIGHIFSTQQALIEVQQLENEFERAQRLYNEQRLTYDRMVGPNQIYRQAREQGYINAGAADPIIYINP